MDTSTTPVPLLSQEERNDLRMKVLRREQLSVEEARRVFETLRARHVELTIEGESKPRRKRSKKSLSDEELDVSLDKALDL